jgi:arginase
VDVTLITVPYHLGRPGEGAALGPERILHAAAARGLHPRIVEVRPARQFENELATTIDVDAVLAAAVERELAAGRLPITLAADCISSLGSIAGMAGAGDRTGVVWLDAHGDFNTVASSPSGYLDGMALAAATGLELRSATAGLDRLEPIRATNVVHVGGRDFDPGEVERLRAAGATVVSPAAVRSQSPDFHFVTALAGRIDGVYLHVDLDVLDPSEGVANAYAAPDGPSADELASVIGACLTGLPVRTIAFTAYDPDFDVDGRIAAIAGGLIEMIEERQSTWQ